VSETKVRDLVEELEISEGEADRLIATYIAQHPNRSGRHEAHSVTDTGWAQVWRLIPYLRTTSVSEVEEAYRLSEEAVIAAIAYYGRHRQLFDAKLLLYAEEEANP
jgi:hypothetical protein